MPVSQEAILHILWKKSEPTMCGCWVWTGAVTAAGYGVTQIDYAIDYVHRIAYRTLKGPIPENLQIDHKCRVRACWNPAHLEAVSQRVNLLRGNSRSAINARKTHCQNGHSLSGNNLIREPNGGRRCLECRRIWKRKNKGSMARRARWRERN